MVNSRQSGKCKKKLSFLNKIMSNEPIALCWFVVFGFIKNRLEHGTKAGKARSYYLRVNNVVNINKISVSLVK